MSTIHHQCPVVTCHWSWRQPEGEAPECPRCKRIEAKAQAEAGPPPRDPAQ